MLSIIVKNILIDNNIVLDYFSYTRREVFPESIKCFECLLESSFAFISSSSLDNLAYVKMKYLRDEGKSRQKTKELIKDFIGFLLNNFKIAKTPSYIEIDFEDIEDSQIIASARAADALVLTRDEGMLNKYTSETISPRDFLSKYSKQSITKRESVSIDFANLKKQYVMYQPELEAAMDKVLNQTEFIMGDAVRELEENLENFTGVRHAITCSSGTDALLLAMMALNIKPNDEIITTPFTFIATAETIAFLRAKPVYVDIDERTYNIDPAKIADKITSKTKAIMPVSLYGQPADMDAIQAIADRHNLKVIIDGAQSFGGTFNGVYDSNLGDIATTSFFPAKPLGCFGDGGAVFTNNSELAKKIKMLRVHGQNKRYHHKYIGMGGRMDTIQCAIVDVKLKHYEIDLALRQEVAGKYTEALEDNDVVLPFIDERATSAYAQYSIRVKNRDEVQAKLKEQGIPTAVHYPMPLHLQECFKYLNYKEGDFPIAEKVSKDIVSLPMNPYVKDYEIEYICENL